MAIKMKRPAFYKLSATKEFTDRTEPRKAFWNRYAKMVSEGSTVITFYGAGGVGKTALLEKLEEEIKHRDKLTGNECKYVKYDLNISTDSREVLKTFKFQLSAYGCTFPLFDAGNYYYSLKIGQDVTPRKAKSMMEKIPWLKNVKKNLSKVDETLGDKSPILGTDTADLLLLDMADEVLDALPVTRAITTCFSIVDTLLIKHMESTKILDEDHQAIRNQLNACRLEKNPVALYEFLPTLFAMDVADWITATGNKLIVLFDNYEALAGATTLATDEQLKRDLWLRGDNGLIFMIPDTLWTIAGRNKLRWSGDELEDELEQHLIKALSPEDSAWFLEKAGVADENLRDGLVKLTEGYPIFLDLCVDVYAEYKRQHNAEPTIDEFGQKREEVIGRIFRYLDAAGDDAAKDMLEYLCVLNVWTDEIAIDIGGKALHNFSRNTYKRVKNFSFIESDLIEDDDISFTVYNFDRTIQSILIADCDEKLIADVKAATNEYFQNFFADNNESYLKNMFYLHFWAEFVARFADNADALREDYLNTLSWWVDTLIDIANFYLAEDILKVFMSKIENRGETDTVSYAYFELDLSWLRRAQGNYNEAYELANSAYEKCTRLLGDEHPDTVGAMQGLANSLRKLGRYNEALELQEQVLMLAKKIFGNEHPDTVRAMHNLANSLGYLGRYDEALKLFEKVLSLYKKILGDEHPDTVEAMNNLAISLNKLGRYDEALKLLEKVLSLRKKILGDEHPYTVRAMNNLASSLSYLGRYDEALTLMEIALPLYKEIFGEDSPKMLEATDTLAHALSGLGRCEEAIALERDTLAKCEKNFGDEHPLSVIVTKNLVEILFGGGERDEAIQLIERAATLASKVLGDEHPETKEILELREKILNS